MSPLQQLQSIRAACSHQVTRMEISPDELGLSLHQLREDSGVSLEEMAAHLKLSTEVLGSHEYAGCTLPMSIQWQYVKLCAKRQTP